MSPDSGAQPGYLEVDGRRLEYLAEPPRREGLPTIVLLHEGLGCVAMWQDFPQRIAAATGAAVFCYSRAGYGGSAAASLPRRVDYMHREALDVLPRVLAAAGIERSLLVGHSDGGSIALIHAGGSADACCAGLALLAPHVFNEQLCVDSIRRARVSYLRDGLRAKLARYHGEQVDETFYGWNDIWLHPDFWHWNIEAYLPRIKVPLLLLQGEQDEYGTAAQVTAIEAGVTVPCTTHWLAQCGHSPHRDQPRQTLAAIAQFVAAIAPPPAPDGTSG